MQEFKGKTAVITGGASGIGFALANECAARQMNVVLADIEIGALEAAVADLESRQCPALGVHTDTRQKEALDNLLAETIEKFGNVHLLFNNAGVVNGGTPTPIWALPDADWNWVLGVNFYGVLNGVQSFVPHMIGHGEEGHIVNTASIAAFIPGGGPYAVSKYGVIILSENLSRDLTAAGANIGCSVVCPGWVNTKIGDAERNRPEALASPNNPDGAGLGIDALLAGSKSPADLATIVFESIENNHFYIMPHTGWDYLLREHTESILARGDVHQFDLATHIASRAAGQDV